MGKAEELKEWREARDDGPDYREMCRLKDKQIARYKARIKEKSAGRREADLYIMSLRDVIRLKDRRIQKLLRERNAMREEARR